MVEAQMVTQQGSTLPAPAAATSRRVAGLQRKALLVVMAAWCAGACGCGHKAPPFPPPLKNPAQTTDLMVLQRGQAAILSFSYPQTTMAGEHLERLERIEIWRTKKPVAPPTDAAAVDEAEQDAVSTQSEPDELAAAKAKDEEAQAET
ncbi:MAG: hypothetical protein OEW19_22760, partial [Acidobacteriota bacterium]|nr:hypothetical protein [Acidobacteriota bacterium]